MRRRATPRSVRVSLLVSVAALGRTAAVAIGRRRLAPLEVLASSSDRRDVRRAETAWRRPLEKQGNAPPRSESDAALRALGAVADGDRIKSRLAASKTVRGDAARMSRLDAIR